MYVTRYDMHDRESLLLKTMHLENSYHHVIPGIAFYDPRVLAQRHGVRARIIFVLMQLILGCIYSTRNAYRMC